VGSHLISISLAPPGGLVLDYLIRMKGAGGRLFASPAKRCASLHREGATCGAWGRLLTADVLDSKAMDSLDLTSISGRRRAETAWDSAFRLTDKKVWLPDCGTSTQHLPKML